MTAPLLPVVWVILIAALAIATQVVGQTYQVTRLNDSQPILTRQHFIDAAADADVGTIQGQMSTEGGNTNGPSVIGVPDWLRSRLAETPAADANYLMYFAHHRGEWIRLAHARQIEGPWVLYNADGRAHPKGQRGVLDPRNPDDARPEGQRRRGPSIPLAAGLSIGGHIASPDVFLDAQRKRVVMYFHGGGPGGQKTFVATSADGLNFNPVDRGGQEGHGPRPVVCGYFYFRVFAFRGQAYAFSNTGFLYRAPDGAGPVDDAAWTPPAGFDLTRELWTRTDGPVRQHLTQRDLSPDSPRHFALHRVGDVLHVFFTRKGVVPESVVLLTVDLAASDGDWQRWEARSPVAGEPHATLLTPDLPWEGSELARRHGTGGAARPDGERALRDPCIFQDDDGHLYLFYAGRGEGAIGLARLELAAEGKKKEQQ